MNKWSLLFFCSFLIFSISCTKKDGIYCAKIDYYNPRTGTRSLYMLKIKVRNNQLSKIYWSNGGWLDKSHFIPPPFDRWGHCSFRSDKGYKYEVQIIGDETCNE